MQMQALVRITVSQEELKIARIGKWVPRQQTCRTNHLILRTPQCLVLSVSSQAPLTQLIYPYAPIIPNAPNPFLIHSFMQSFSSIHSPYFLPLSPLSHFFLLFHLSFSPCNYIAPFSFSPPLFVPDFFLAATHPQLISTSAVFFE